MFVFNFISKFLYVHNSRLWWQSLIPPYLTFFSTFPLSHYFRDSMMPQHFERSAELSGSSSHYSFVVVCLFELFLIQLTVQSNPAYWTLKVTWFSGVRSGSGNPKYPIPQVKMLIFTGYTKWRDTHTSLHLSGPSQCWKHQMLQRHLPAYLAASVAVRTRIHKGGAEHTNTHK